MEETQNTKLTTCVFVILCSQEESDEAKKLKEARLAAYAAKKAKSKFPEIAVYFFFLTVFLNGTLQKQNLHTKKQSGCGALFEDVTWFEYLGMALKIRNGKCNEVAEK